MDTKALRVKAARWFFEMRGLELTGGEKKNRAQFLKSLQKTLEGFDVTN